MKLDLDIPDSWQKRRIRDVGEVVTGRTPSTKREEFYGGDYNLISPADLDNGKYVVTAHKRLTDIGFMVCRALPQNSVLVSCIGNVGKLGMVSNEQSATNQQINAIICNKSHDSHFIYYCLYGNRARLERAADKTTLPILNKTNFEDFEIPLPPLDEQRKIAGVLGLVQRAMEQQERLIALTTELKKTLIHQLFTQGLHGEPQKQTEIGPVPQSWEIVPLNTLLTEPLRNGHSAKASNNGEGIRTLTLTAVTRRDFSVENTKLTVADPHRVREMWLRSGDILVERANTFEYVGLTALYEGPSDFAIFPDLMIRVRVDKDKIRPKFLAEFLLTPVCRSYFQKQARSTAGNFPKIDQGTIEQTLVPLPSAKEQDEIVSLLTQIDRKLSVHVRKHAALTALFRTLLHQLMTAQIRVNQLGLI